MYHKIQEVIIIMNSKNGNMTEGSIIKPILSFVYPVLLTALFQNLYNAFDAMMVGKLASNGKYALGAVGSMGSMIDLFTGFFMGMSAGACVIIAQNYGAKDKKALSDSVHTSIALSIIIGAIVSILGVFLSPFAIKITNSPPEVAPIAESYLRIIFLGMIPTTVYNFGAGILRAVGDSKRPLVYLVISSIFNIVFNYIFIVFFDMSANGVATATVIAETVSAFLVIMRLIRTNEDYKLHIKKIRIHPNVVKKTFRLGIPSGLQATTFSISNVIVQSEFNSFGASVVAARAAVSKFESFAWAIAYSFGIAATTFAGQNKGAMKFDRIKKGMWVSLLSAVIALMTASAISILFSENIIGIFNSDPEVVSIGKDIILVMMSCYFLCGVMETLSGTIRGSGAPLFPMISSMLGIVGGRLVWIFTMKHFFPGNLTMLMMAYPVSWTVICTVLFMFYKKGRNHWLYF